jgi:TPR repeat protein
MTIGNKINLNAFKEKAEAGDANAQYEMAFIENEYTDPILDDGNRSLAWLEKAANQGHSNAQLTLGLYFLFETERKLLFKRYESKCANTPMKLAFTLVIAKLFNTNDDQAAVNWLTQAAEQNNPDGKLWLGYCHYHGFGVTQNYEVALELFKQAAAYGLSDAMILIALIYIKGSGVDIDYQAALTWLNKAVKLNNDYAFYLMGHIYANGKGVEKDIKLAYEWYEKAALLNVEAAQYLLALNCLADEGKYWYWMERAADNGHVKAKHTMAIHYLRLAGNYGSAEAQLALGKCYERGTGVEKNSELAHDYFERSLFLTKSKDQSMEESGLEIEISRLKKEGIIDAETAENLNRKAEISYKEKLSLQKDLSKQKIENIKAVEEKEREMLSFFTHTMRNALATAPESLRQAIHLLSGDVYEQDIKHYQAINKIAALFSTLSLTDCLIDTFKQSISDPQEFKQSWRLDHSGDATPRWVIALALKQSLNRIIFMSDTTELRKLLNNQETALIKATRKSFIDDVLPLNVDHQGIDTFYEWSQNHIPTIELITSNTDNLSFGVNQIRFSLLFAITSELILNALKYWDGENHIHIGWVLNEQNNYMFSVKNHCKANAVSNLAGTHKGLAFIKRLIELLGEHAQFICKTEDQFFTAELILNRSLFDEES